MKDSLGDRMKTNYENITRMFLPRRTHTIIRLDGKAFHTYTRGLERPFDRMLTEDMQKTTIALCEQIEGVVFGYTQSDEISLLLTDFATESTEAWFKGNVQKIVSISASIATAAFNAAREGRPETMGGKYALFDSRTYTIPDRVEVANYFVWRQKDATRNSIQMAAQAVFSHKQLHGKGWSDLNEMLFQKGINFNEYHSHCKRGSVIVKKQRKEKMLNRKTKEMVEVTRNRWEVLDETPMFTHDGGRRFLSRIIPTPAYLNAE